MRYRVAMVAASPFPVSQGSQVLVRQTAELLRDRGHDVHLVVYGYGIGEAPSGISLHRAANPPGARKTLAGPSWAKPLQDAAMVAVLRRVTRMHAIDIVHAHNYEGLLVALMAGTRPVVYHAHNCMRDELPYFISPAWLSRGLGGIIDATFPRRADAVVALHTQARDYLIEHGCRPETLEVIPPPVDGDLVAPVLTHDALPTVVYTGNLDRYQNLALLHHAMTIVRKSEPRAKLIVATADSRNISCDTRVEIHDTAALRNLLAEDVVVACPRTSWSGYPIKLLNAMASGKAIVACAGAAPGIIHGETGLVVPDDDAHAFADALLELLRDPGLRRRLGEAAQRVALERHDPDAVGQRLEALYARTSGV